MPLWSVALLKMWLFLLLINLCGYFLNFRSWAREFASSAIHDCQVTPVWGGSDLVALLCRLRTIDSGIDEPNFRTMPPLNTVKLKIVCSDVLFFQSALQNKSFSHLKNLENLDIEYCKVGEVPKEAFRGLTKLKNLTLNTYNTDWPAMALTLSPDVFLDQQKLEMLDLADNNIWTLPARIFCQLENLTFLNFSRNKLQDIRDLSFSNGVGRCAPRLRYLDLSMNYFVRLPEFSFGALKNLTTLNISRNDIRAMNDQVFFGMYSLEILDASHNGIETMPPELFKENKRLTKFYAQNNSISVLAPGLFTGLDMLLELDLSQNKLTNTWVNSETFMDLLRLATLDLSFNRITRLDVATFRDLTNLQILSLENKEISSIADNTFRGLFRLHTLLLSTNKLVTIDANTLRGLISLGEIGLGNNKLYRLHEDAFINCTKLKSLKLSNNSFNVIPHLIGNIQTLRNLDLSHNNIKEIKSEDFVELKELISLYIDNNLIRNIKIGVFQSLISIQVLNMAGNGIRTIENGAFNNSQHLRAVRLDSNKLKNVHGLFSTLSNLRWLNLSKNHLEMFDFAFIPKELEYLDLRHNNLNELGNHFEIESQLHLKVLDASFNNIRDISASSVPDSVESLFLNNNYIFHIEPYTFFKKKNLSRVDLSSNRIKIVDQNSLRLSIIDSDETVPEFYLAQNPFECDCTLHWLQNVNSHEKPRQTPKVVDLSSIVCRLLSRRGPSFVPILEADKLQFLCHYESHCFPLCHCCDFDACDCEMICPFNCTCSHDQSWAANIVDCVASGQQSVPEKIPMDASEVYLDGNHLSSLSSHVFIGRKNLKYLFLNNSHVSVIHNRTFNGLKKLKIIYLDHNNLSVLKGFEFEHLIHLEELYLDKNQLTAIHNTTFLSLQSLKILRLDHNLLTSLSFTIFNDLTSIQSLWMGHNLWICQCAFLEESKSWSEETDKQIFIDQDSFYCFENGTNVTYTIIEAYQSICGIGNLTINYPQIASQSYLFFPTISLGICAILLTSILAIFCNRSRLKVWLHSKYGVRICHSKPEVGDESKLFDAFVSYSSKDEVFVTQILAPELERGTPSYKLCLHYRDFPVGSYVSDTILGAVENSRKTIIVLSENFIKSEWSRVDFRSAHHEVLRDRKKRVIVIILGEVPQREMDPDLKLFLKTNTFLKWGDNRFWGKLKFALPDAIPSRTHPLRCLQQQSQTTQSDQSQQPQLQPQNHQQHLHRNNHTSPQQASQHHHHCSSHHHHHHHHCVPHNGTVHANSHM